jgi:hypothetical protein
VTKQKRPEGQKKAKAKLKGKTTALSPLGDQPTQNMVLYHEAASIKVAAMMKAAEATSNTAEAKKEKNKMEKYQTYIQLSQIDTSNYSAAKLKAHGAILEQVVRELTE